MGCGGSEDKGETVEVKEPVETAEEDDTGPKGIPAHVFVTDHFRIDLQTTEENTVAAVINKVNEVLHDYDGWTDKDCKVMNLSSKWALCDHLEYCAEDKLSELDHYEEHQKSGELYFLAINPDSFPIESYDAHDLAILTHTAGHWGEDGNHVITIKDVLD